MPLWSEHMLRTLQTPCHEFCKASTIRPSPGGGARRSPGWERLEQGTVADLHLHPLHGSLERVRRDLSQHAPGILAATDAGDTELP
jgi:hypothetical protein